MISILLVIKYDDYPNLSDTELQNLKEVITNTLGNMKSDIKKKKLKVLGKTLLSSLIIVGGVAVAIVFPSPIVLAALGGAATLITGNNEVIKQVKNIKKKSKVRKESKEEVKSLDIEQSNRKWAVYMQGLVKQAETPPTAPLYPDLKQS